MTLAVVGAVLLLVLAFMIWRGHISVTAAIVSIVFGIVVAHVGFAQVAHSAASGIQTAFSAVANSTSGGKGR